MPPLASVNPDYKGPTIIEGWVRKIKDGGLSKIFGSDFNKRYLVLNMRDKIFYYVENSKHGPHLGKFMRFHLIRNIVLEEPMNGPSAKDGWIYAISVHMDEKVNKFILNDAQLVVNYMEGLANVWKPDTTVPVYEKSELLLTMKEILQTTGKPPTVEALSKVKQPTNFAPTIKFQESPLTQLLVDKKLIPEQPKSKDSTPVKEENTFTPLKQDQNSENSAKKDENNKPTPPTDHAQKPKKPKPKEEKKTPEPLKQDIHQNNPVQNPSNPIQKPGEDQRQLLQVPELKKSQNSSSSRQDSNEHLDSSTSINSTDNKYSQHQLTGEPEPVMNRRGSGVSFDYNQSRKKSERNLALKSKNNSPRNKEPELWDAEADDLGSKTQRNRIQENQPEVSKFDEYVSARFMKGSVPNPEANTQRPQDFNLFIAIDANETKDKKPRAKKPIEGEKAVREIAPIQSKLNIPVRPPTGNRKKVEEDPYGPKKLSDLLHDDDFLPEKEEEPMVQQLPMNKEWESPRESPHDGSQYDPASNRFSDENKVSSRHSSLREPPQVSISDDGSNTNARQGTPENRNFSDEYSRKQENWPSRPSENRESMNPSFENQKNLQVRTLSDERMGNYQNREDENRFEVSHKQSWEDQGRSNSDQWSQKQTRFDARNTQESGESSRKGSEQGAYQASDQKTRFDDPQRDRSYETNFVKSSYEDSQSQGVKRDIENRFNDSQNTPFQQSNQNYHQKKGKKYDANGWEITEENEIQPKRDPEPPKKVKEYVPQTNPSNQKIDNDYDNWDDELETSGKNGVKPTNSNPGYSTYQPYNPSNNFRSSDQNQSNYSQPNFSHQNYSQQPYSFKFENPPVTNISNGSRFDNDPSKGYSKYSPNPQSGNGNISNANNVNKANPVRNQEMYEDWDN